MIETKRTGLKKLCFLGEYNYSQCNMMTLGEQTLKQIGGIEE